MNQLVATDTRANLELAKAFAESKMVPDHFKKSVGDCYIAINLAAHYGMEPWMLMQEMYIISGKPMMSGKMATAILNHSLADPLRPEYSGDGEERMITLSGRPEGEAQPLTVTLKVKDAKTQNEQWRKNPDQMLMYAASRMWGRRYTPDIILGIVFDDEEIPGVTTSLVPDQPRTQLEPPGRPGSPDHALSRKLGEAPIDQETGEVLDTPVALPKKDAEKWYDWGVRLVSCVRSSPDIDTVDKWLAENSDVLDVCKKDAPKVHGNILSAVNQAKMELLQKEEAGK
jgi:hypothetical protein